MSSPHCRGSARQDRESWGKTPKKSSPSPRPADVEKILLQRTVYLGNDTDTLLKTKTIEEKAVPARVFLERFSYALRLALNGTGSILWARVLDRMKRRKQLSFHVLLPASSPV